MSIRTTPWPAGIPCWADVATDEPAVTRQFYGAVLDWTFTDPVEAFGGYFNAMRDGHLVAGCGPRTAGVPATWTLYLATADAERTAALALDNGGQVVFGPHPVGDLGSMLGLLDPAGLFTGVWQAGTHTGVQLTNQPGGMVWEDGRSPDPRASRDFLAAVFGHSFEAMPEAGDDYATIHLSPDSPPVGGLGRSVEGGPAGWLVYFGIDDVAAAGQRALEQGGRVQRSWDSPYGRMATLLDPSGAEFALVEVDVSRMPDRSS